MHDRFILVGQNPDTAKDHIIVCDNFGNYRGYYMGQPEKYRKLEWWEFREWPLQVTWNGVEYTALSYDPDAKDGFGLQVDGFTYPQHPGYFEEVN